MIIKSQFQSFQISYKINIQNSYMKIIVHYKIQMLISQFA